MTAPRPMKSPFPKTSHNNVLIKTITQLMMKFGINETQLARECGLPQPTINRILSGKTPDPRLSTLTKIAERFQLTMGQLLSDGSLDEEEKQAQRVICVPVISWVNAVKGPEYIASLRIDNGEIWVNTEIKLPSSSFALVTKPSMEPRFPRNSLLLIDPEACPRDGDMVIVHFKNSEEAALRELLIDGPIKQLKPILPDTHSSTNVTFNLKEQIILGVVVQVKYQTR